MTAAPPADLPLTERAYRHLRQAIVRCEFEPGERLRVDDLSQRLDISSSPVREALNRLAQQRFVRALDNRGFRVAPLTIDGITDLTRVRVLVECEALRDAIANGDDAWEAAAVAAAHSLGRVESRLGDKPVALDNEWSERHRAFHLSLYAACSSPLLLDLADNLFDSAERYRRHSAKHRAVDRAKHNEHRDLLRSVLSRDADAAVQRLARHIGATQRLVVKALAEMPTGTS